MIETHPESKSAETPSLWRLVFQSYIALIVVIVLGVLLSIPVMHARMRYKAEATYILGARPANDEQLKAWVLAQPGVFAFDTERQGDDLQFRLVYKGSTGPRLLSGELAAQMRQLGYDFLGMRESSTEPANGPTEVLTDLLILAAILAGMQIAFGFVGYNRVRAARRRGASLPGLFPRKHGRAVAYGVLGGVGLIAVGVVYSFVLTALLGHAAPSPWDAAKLMPASSRLVFMAFGAIGAPITEEIFFRGYLFGKFKRAGYTLFGVIFTAVLFAAVHFSDKYNVPVILIFGICLAWLYHRTGSLLAPITAHVINNGLAVLMMFVS